MSPKTQTDPPPKRVERFLIYLCSLFLHSNIRRTYLHKPNLDSSIKRWYHQFWKFWRMCFLTHQYLHARCSNISRGCVARRITLKFKFKLLSIAFLKKLVILETGNVGFLLATRSIKQSWAWVEASCWSS